MSGCTPVISWREWAPVYDRIVNEFGFDRCADRRARDELANLAADSPLQLADLPELADRTVAIAGGAPTLAADIERAATADRVIAASDAAGVLLDAGVDVLAMVTDLDKRPAVAHDVIRAGGFVAVHAHGDNRPALAEWVPQLRLDRVLPTTQVRPRLPVVNTGGFTDGDRAAFLAAGCGAGELTFPGWDFDDANVPKRKHQKLRWAARLLYWLERRRGDRFSLLDDRRSSLDLTGFPPP